MKEFKGTPGPWVAVGGEVTSEDYTINGVIYADHICNCEEVDGESPNANLIAAAPDLLEALIEARVWVQGWNAANESEESYKALVACNEAIARALGESK